MELPHKYGEHVHLLADPFLLTLLARIGSPETDSHTLVGLVRTAYLRLCAEVLAAELPVQNERIETRMAAMEPRAFYQGPTFRPTTKLVICSVLRAGIVPAQTCFELAGQVLPPAHVRLDFVNVSRETDEHGHVTGTRLHGSKIGGPVRDAVLLIPDPMGATGGTVEHVARVYQEVEGGPPARVVAAHLMLTPEAIRRLAASCPHVHLYSARLDRGLSPPEVLASEPGTFPDKERGLNDVQYIVPGAGGMGELLTNSWA